MTRRHASMISGKVPLPAMPSVEAIDLAVQMMNAPGAPSFPTKHDKREATVELARALWISQTPKRRRK